MRQPALRLKLVALALIASVPIASHLYSRAGQTMSLDPAAAPTAAPAQGSPAPFPTGFDYPQAAATVEAWVRHRDENRAREHGWYLWAGLNQTTAGGDPVWRTWPTSTQAFAPPPGLTAQAESKADMMRKSAPLNAKRLADGPRTPNAPKAEEPINFPVTPQYPVPAAVKQKYPQCVQNGALVDGPTYQNNGDVMVAGVIYSDAAYKWIRSKGLYLGSVLDAQKPPPGGISHIAPMPSASFALKPMMWPVSRTGYTALPVWDDLRSDGGTYAGFEIQSKWKRAVAVTAPTATQLATVPVKYLYGVTMNNNPLGPNSYQNAKVVPVTEFYNFRPDPAALSPCDRALLDQSAYWAYNRAFEKGDYLVLIAMHVMTKEQPDWTFQSVWWSDRPNEGPYAENRPRELRDKAKGPWDHYLMTSTYGVTTAPPPDDTKWPVAYNPYIELAAGHPIQTNCMNCHHRSAWPGFATSAPVKASYEAPGGPTALDAFDEDNPVFDNLLTLDSMWGVSDRARLSSAKPPRAGARDRR